MGKPQRGRALSTCVGKESSRCVPRGSEQAMHQLQKGAAPGKSPADAGGDWGPCKHLPLGCFWLLAGREGRRGAGRWKG